MIVQIIGVSGKKKLIESAKNDRKMLPNIPISGFDICSFFLKKKDLIILP